MHFEERERQKRIRLIKVMIAEAGMVLAVLVIVAVAVLAAMGFFVSSNGNIEQSGLIQIHSIPTGGTVELDGTTLFARTNLSRTMSASEHDIKISREGYDTWEKTIQMYSGMLIRLYYPRLFLENREPEEVLSLKDDLMFYSVSRDKTNVLYGESGSAEWTLLNIKNDEVRETKLDLSAVLPDAEEKKFAGSVEILEWNKDSDYVLVKAKLESKIEWILVDLKNTSKSLNLTKTFGLEFERVEMMDHSATQLFALENHHLRRINTSDQAISRVLLEQVLDFDTDGTDLIYVAERTKDNEKEKVVGVYRDGEKAGTIITTFGPEESVKVALTEYYDEDYLVIVNGNELAVRYGVLPSYREGTPELGENSDLKDLVVLSLATTPKQLKVSPDGEYVVAQNGTQYMVVDLDMGDLYEYDLGTDKMHFFEDGMMSLVQDGSLEVFDFDYTNRRVLVQKVAAESNEELTPVTTRSEAAVLDYEVAIANNNKWLYYLVRSDKGLSLMREKVRD